MADGTGRRYPPCKVPLLYRLINSRFTRQRWLGGPTSADGLVGAGGDFLLVPVRFGARRFRLTTQRCGPRRWYQPVSSSQPINCCCRTMQARPTQGSFHFRMDDADIVVTYISEAARIDLNFAPKDVLAKLFAGLGADEAAAQEYADRIIGWRTRPAPGAANDEDALYGAAGLGYSPRQSLFTHVNELALVVGLPPALVDRALAVRDGVQWLLRRRSADRSPGGDRRITRQDAGQSE